MRLVGEPLRGGGYTLCFDETELVDVGEQVVDIVLRAGRGAARFVEATDVGETVGHGIADFHRRELRVDERDGRDLVSGAIGPRVDRALNIVRVPAVLSKGRFGVGITRLEIARAGLEGFGGIARQL